MGKHKAYRETSFFPANFTEHRYSLEHLRVMAHRASVNLRGWPFIFISDARPGFTHNLNDGIETKIEGPVLGSHGIHYHYWQLKQSGLLYTKQTLNNFSPSGADPENPHVGFVDLAFLTFEAVQCLTKLYDGDVADSESITFQFTLTGIKGWELFVSPLMNTVYKGVYIAHDDIIKYKKQLPFIEWKAGMIDHAIEVCKYVFPRFNWDSADLDEYRRWFEQLNSGKLPHIALM